MVFSISVIQIHKFVTVLLQCVIRQGSNGITRAASTTHACHTTTVCSSESAGVLSGDHAGLDVADAALADITDSTSR